MEIERTGASNLLLHKILGLRHQIQTLKGAGQVPPKELENNLGVAEKELQALDPELYKIYSEQLRAGVFMFESDKTAELGFLSAKETLAKYSPEVKRSLIVAALQREPWTKSLTPEQLEKLAENIAPIFEA